MFILIIVALIFVGLFMRFADMDSQQKYNKSIRESTGKSILPSQDPYHVIYLEDPNK